MKTITLTILILLTSLVMQGQERIDWAKEEIITIKSFKAPCPEMVEDGQQRYTLATTFDFNFQMLNLQFAFTKNFNKYVSAYYIPESSWLEEGEQTDQILKMSNLSFDIMELYARKFRKKLYETKNVGSNVNFYQEQFNEINNEYNVYMAKLNSEIAASENQDETIDRLIMEVNEEIDNYNEFCKLCKPKKKKRKRKKKK